MFFFQDINQPKNKESITLKMFLYDKIFFATSPFTQSQWNPPEE